MIQFVNRPVQMEHQVVDAETDLFCSAEAVRMDLLDQAEYFRLQRVKSNDVIVEDMPALISLPYYVNVRGGQRLQLPAVICADPENESAVRLIRISADCMVYKSRWEHKDVSRFHRMGGNHQYTW